MTITGTSEAQSAEVVLLEGGPVTLAPIDQLVARRDRLTEDAKDLENQAARLRQDAAEKARNAATYLVAQRSKWDSTGVSEELSQIDSLTGRIDTVDAQLAELDGTRRRGLSGFFKRFSDRQRRTALIKERDQAASDVNSTLMRLGAHAPVVTIPAADALLAAAREDACKADVLQGQRNDITTSIAPLIDEIGRRQEAMTKLGFDALWTAAWLRDHDPTPIDSPVTLKKNEVAWLSMSCTLSRQATRTQWVGSSQGVSFPIGHTGIRYRVGGYSGHPIQSTFIKDLDSGSLVLTNQRLVFVGRIKSVTIALPHIVHVETYTDALGVFQDRRETPDFFKVQTPQYVLFYINYAISRLTETVSRRS